MDADEQIRKLKQIPPLSKEEKRSKLKTFIVLSLATFISVLFLVYAFIQKLEADKQKEVSVQFIVEAQKQREEAEKQRAMAFAAQKEADKQRVLAIEALKNCEKNKR